MSAAELMVVVRVATSVIRTRFVVVLVRVVSTLMDVLHHQLSAIDWVAAPGTYSVGVNSTVSVIVG